MKKINKDILGMLLKQTTMLDAKFQGAPEALAKNRDQPVKAITGDAPKNSSEAARIETNLSANTLKKTGAAGMAAWLGDEALEKIKKQMLELMEQGVWGMIAALLIQLVMSAFGVDLDKEDPSADIPTPEQLNAPAKIGEMSSVASRIDPSKVYTPMQGIKLDDAQIHNLQNYVRAGLSDAQLKTLYEGIAKSYENGTPAGLDIAKTLDKYSTYKLASKIASDESIFKFSDTEQKNRVINALSTKNIASLSAEEQKMANSLLLVSAYSQQIDNTIRTGNLESNLGAKELTSHPDSSAAGAAQINGRTMADAWANGLLDKESVKNIRDICASAVLNPQKSSLSDSEKEAFLKALKEGNISNAEQVVDAFDQAMGVNTGFKERLTHALSVLGWGQKNDILRISGGGVNFIDQLEKYGMTDDPQKLAIFLRYVMNTENSLEASHHIMSGDKLARVFSSKGLPHVDDDMGQGIEIAKYIFQKKSLDKIDSSKLKTYMDYYVNDLKTRYEGDPEFSKVKDMDDFTILGWGYRNDAATAHGLGADKEYMGYSKEDERNVFISIRTKNAFDSGNNVRQKVEMVEVKAFNEYDVADVSNKQLTALQREIPKAVNEVPLSQPDLVIPATSNTKEIKDYFVRYYEEYLKALEENDTLSDKEKEQRLLTLNAQMAVVRTLEEKGITLNLEKDQNGNDISHEQVIIATAQEYIDKLSNENTYKLGTQSPSESLKNMLAMEYIPEDAKDHILNLYQGKLPLGSIDSNFSVRKGTSLEEVKQKISENFGDDQEKIKALNESLGKDSILNMPDKINQEKAWGIDDTYNDVGDVEEANKSILKTGQRVYGQNTAVLSYDVEVAQLTSGATNYMDFEKIYNEFLNKQPEPTLTEKMALVTAINNFDRYYREETENDLKKGKSFDFNAESGREVLQALYYDALERSPFDIIRGCNQEALRNQLINLLDEDARHNPKTLGHGMYLGVDEFLKDPEKYYNDFPQMAQTYMRLLYEGSDFNQNPALGNWKNTSVGENMLFKNENEKNAFALFANPYREHRNIDGTIDVGFFIFDKNIKNSDELKKGRIVSQIEKEALENKNSPTFAKEGFKYGITPTILTEIFNIVAYRDLPKDEYDISKKYAARIEVLSFFREARDGRLSDDSKLSLTVNGSKYDVSAKDINQYPAKFENLINKALSGEQGYVVNSISIQGDQKMWLTGILSKKNELDENNIVNMAEQIKGDEKQTKFDYSFGADR